MAHRYFLPNHVVSMLSVISVSLLACAALEADEAALATQRDRLSEATAGAGFGPQSPRDIDMHSGENPSVFARAPHYQQMNVCNIHFHESAEHRGGEFTQFVGFGDQSGYGSGYGYSGQLTEAELAPIEQAVGETTHGDLQPGDTIEVHYVHTTADVEPGPSLGACLSDATANPQLRVEAQVFVLVNDPSAGDFVALTALGRIDDLHQAVNIPQDTGTPIEYAGSTTGPAYNEKGSPFQVTWAVRPAVKKVHIATVATWLQQNVFDEEHAHGVRNLVVNPSLLSPIGH